MPSDQVSGRHEGTGKQSETQSKIQAIFESLNNSERHGLKFGLFPARLQALTIEESVELIKLAGAE